MHLAGAGALFAATFVVCFLIGSLNPAHFIARLRGQDIRGAGSGNPGATNAGRLLGVKWGVVVGLLDILKALSPVLVVDRFAGLYAALVAGIAAVLGHMFSPFLGGKGGKGVATAFGAALAIAPWVALGGVALFAASALVFHKMGRGALVAFTAMFLVGGLVVAGPLAWVSPPVGWWLMAVSALVLARHRKNFTAWVQRTP